MTHELTYSVFNLGEIQVLLPPIMTDRTTCVRCHNIPLCKTLDDLLGETASSLLRQECHPIAPLTVPIKIILAQKNI